MTLRIHWIVHFKQMNYISVWVTSWDKRNPEYAKHWRQSTRDEKRPKQKNWNEKQLIQENFLEKKKFEIVLGNKVLHTECNDPRMTSTKLQQKKKKMKEFVAGVGWGEKFRSKHQMTSKGKTTQLLFIFISHEAKLYDRRKSYNMRKSLLRRCEPIFLITGKINYFQIKYCFPKSSLGTH